MNLKKKVVLITGSSSGIGRETALAFAEKGAIVIITYSKNRKGGESVFNECKKMSESFLVQLDICSNNSIKSAVDRIVKKFGKIDILINNAGVLYCKLFSQQSLDEIENQIKVNLIGLIKVTSLVLPVMKKIGNGLIINIASLKGKKPFKKRTTYCASKFGVRGFSQALALELPKKIRLYVINPNPTATRLTNFKGDNPKKVANVILKVAEGKINKKSGSDIDVEDYQKWNLTLLFLVQQVCKER